ncbi:MAG: zinc-ribbon domain-containing protein [bacterium]
MKCQKCHHTVTRKSKFCPNCGTSVVPRTAQKPEPTKTGLPLSYGIGLVGIGILVGFAIFKYTSNPGMNSIQAVSNVQNSPKIQSAAVLDIAREFTCPCGTCSDPLDICDCDHKNGAVEVKSFIAQKLQEGHKKPHIIEMVQTTYGGQKKTSEPIFNLEPPFKK